MIRADLEGIGTYTLPAGYSLRRYRPGDEAEWVRIHELADEYNVITAEDFEREFGGDVESLALRQYYLCDARGAAVGTATAWFNDDYNGRPYGRVHWVAIVPDHQGRGLSKPLLGAVCSRLRELGHDRAYLTTDARRIAAICLYLKFGFVPEIRGDADRRAWRLVREKLPPPMRRLVKL
jgi:GNAT superfamily N-acetyltransferase